jgi:predicted butyrate kinase (DUF1464 family)
MNITGPVATIIITLLVAIAGGVFRMAVSLVQMATSIGRALERIESHERRLLALEDWRHTR